MKFSKCNIEIDNNRVKITFKKHKRLEEVIFERNFYKSYAYYKKKSDVEINKWLVGGVLLAIMIIWIVLSENFGDQIGFRNYDAIVMPITIVLFFMTLFFDVLGDVYVMRWLIRLLLFWKKKYIVIVLKSGKEHEIPVRNEEEAIRIAGFIRPGDSN